MLLTASNDSCPKFMKSHASSSVLGRQGRKMQMVSFSILQQFQFLQAFTTSRLYHDAQIPASMHKITLELSLILKHYKDILEVADVEIQIRR